MAESPQPKGTTPASVRPTPQIGSRLERYEIVRAMGQGGMGQVFEARDPNLGRSVALKLLKGAPDATALVRLRREAQALARISHPNVVTVHEVSQAEGIPYVAMELVEGETLKAWLERAPRSVPEILDGFQAAASGLAAAHRAGIVHRDFKPENVMVTQDGRVVVMDFGLARPDDAPSQQTPPSGPPLGQSPGGGDPWTRMVTTTSETPPGTTHVRDTTPDSPTKIPTSDSGILTHAGTILGTPAYMSPEQRAGMLAGPASDQYSFCSALYEALFGVRHSTAAQMEGRVDFPRGTRVPGWVRPLLARGLDNDPDARWPTMDALVSALRSRRRRARLRRIAAVTAASLGVVSSIAWVVAPSKDERTCDAQAQAIDKEWGPTQQEALWAAFDRGGIPTNDPRRVEYGRAIEAYVADWRRVARDTCLRRAENPDAAPMQYEASMQCLTARRSELRGQLEYTSVSDGPQLGESLAGVASLSPVEDCAFRDPATPLAENGEQRRAAHAVLTEAERTRDSGTSAEALAAVNRAIEVAAAPGLEYVLLKGLLLRGEIHRDRFDFAASESDLTRAVWTAVRAGEDRGAAFAAAAVMFPVAAQGRTAEAAEWGDRARVFLERAGGLGTRAEGNLVGSFGVVEALFGDLPAARRHFEEAVDIWTKTGGAANNIRAARSNLGVVNLYLGRLEEAETGLRALTTARESNEDVPALARALTYQTLSMTLVRRGKIDEAAEAIARGRELAIGSAGEDSAVAAYFLADSALVDLHAKRIRDAQATIDTALEILGPDVADARDSESAVALRRAAEIYRTLGNAERALGHAQDALEIIGRVAPAHVEGDWIRLETARIHATRGDRDAALKLLDEAIARQPSWGDPHLLQLLQTERERVTL